MIDLRSRFFDFVGGRTFELVHTRHGLGHERRDVDHDHEQPVSKNKGYASGVAITTLPRVLVPMGRRTDMGFKRLGEDFDLC